ncbi:MAG: phosphoribosylglycinamide formyltransferase [Rhodothermales bacterium]|nr:phosphoribosylglycinamide formyltransferase [Rhodothermales bacterium]
MITSKPLNVAVFASGGGSNFEALAVKFKDSPSIGVSLCVSNRRTAGVLERAERLGIPALVISPSQFTSEKEYVDALLSSLDEHGINFIALAGYLKMIPSGLIDRYRNRITNIHPSLLPAFGGKGMYGRRVHAAVLDAGVQWTGATVHLVDEEYDTGPIVLQEPVPVGGADTPEKLAARVLKVEHRIYPMAIELLQSSDFEIKGRRVIIAEHSG